MSGRALRVLTYHRVAHPEEDPELDPRTISATPEAFGRQMRWLAAHARVVSLAEVLESIVTGRELGARATLITFDDAYRDFLDHAWPVLRALDLPATICVPTAFPDHPERAFTGDRLYRALMQSPHPRLAVEGVAPLALDDPARRRAAMTTLRRELKRLPHAAASTLLERICQAAEVPVAAHRSVLDWDELRVLTRAGIELCAHSRTHPILTNLQPEALDDEVRGSLADLRRELGSALAAFCYPNGSHDERVVAAVREAGFRLAFTTRDGHNALPLDDPFRVRRTNVTPRTTPFLLRLRLTDWGAAVDRFRHRAELA